MTVLIGPHLAYAAALEGDSEHLIARAIREKAQDNNISLPSVTEFSAIKGRGVKAQINGTDVYLGGPKLIEMLGLEPSGQVEKFSKTAGENGQSVVYLVNEGQLVAALTTERKNDPFYAGFVPSLFGLPHLLIAPDIPWMSYLSG